MNDVAPSKVEDAAAEGPSLRAQHPVGDGALQSREVMKSSNAANLILPADNQRWRYSANFSWKKKNVAIEMGLLKSLSRLMLWQTRGKIPREPISPKPMRT